MLSYDYLAVLHCTINGPIKFLENTFNNPSNLHGKKICEWVVAPGSSTSKSFFKDWKYIIESTSCLRISLFCYENSCKSLILWATKCLMKEMLLLRFSES